MKTLACLLLLASSAARADDSDAARAHFMRGTKLYDLGRYLEAAKEYEAAFEAKDDPALLFNIAQAYRGAHSYADAIRSYRAFLRRVPDSEQRPQVESRIHEMQQLIDQQSSTEQRPPVGTVPPSSIEAKPATVDAQPVAVEKPAPKRTPIYKKWWLWTVVGVVAAGAIVAGVTAGLLVNRDSFNPSLGRFSPLMVHF